MAKSRVKAEPKTRAERIMVSVIDRMPPHVFVAWDDSACRVDSDTISAWVAREARFYTDTPEGNAMCEAAVLDRVDAWYQGYVAGENDAV